MGGFVVRARSIVRPSDYRGEEVLGVVATQLTASGVSAPEQRRILSNWIAYLSSTETNIRELQFHSRVPQQLLDSIAGQPQLEALLVKWGPYRDVTSVGQLDNLTTLRLGGATALESLSPLRGLHKLTTLAISEPFKVEDTATLSEFTALTSLMFGNDHPGSDKNVVLQDLQWVTPLRELRSLAIPGTRLVNPDLSPLLGLPHLKELRLPLRRAYRAQVFELAQASEVFTQVAREYEAYESWRAAGRA